MKKDYRLMNGTGRQGILPVFSKLFGIFLAIFFLAGCTTLAPEVSPDNIKPLDLNQVDIDLDAGTITGTTTAMQYSLNSTNGVDGTWTAASNGSTSVTFVEGKVYIRESANHQNVRFVKTLGPNNTIIVDLNDVGINVADGHITGTSTDMEYSLNSTNGTDGIWTAASNVNTEVAFVAGKVYVRETADHDNMRLVATIAAAAAAPTLASGDGANTITGLTALHEYKIDAGSWTIGTTAPDLTGTKSVQVRIKATASALASEIQTIAFTENTSSLIVLFDHNFDEGKTLTELFYTGIGGNTHPAISTVQHASGTSSLGFLESGGNISRYLNSPINTTEVFENVVLEFKAMVMEATSSFTINLYNVGVPVIRINLSNARVLYYHTASATTKLADFTPGEWFSIRIMMTGNKFNVYKDGVLIGEENLSTLEDATGITRLYCSRGGTSEAFLDDIKVSYLPPTP